MIEFSPVFLPDVSVLREELVRLQVLFCPFLGAELLLEEVGVENDCCSEQISEIRGLTFILSGQILCEQLLVLL